MISYTLLTSIIVIVLTKYTIEVLQPHFVRIGLSATNQNGENLPNSLGVVFPIVFIVIATISKAWTIEAIFEPFLLGLFGFSLLGLIDDLQIESCKGLYGHLVRFLTTGTFSIGLFKGIIGATLSLYLAIIIAHQVPVHPLWSALIIAMTANAINSLDVSPGRAGKGVLVVTTIIFSINGFQGAIILVPLIIMVGTYLWGDLKEYYMMGDSGAYALGSYLGITVLITCTTIQIMFFSLGLIVFHILTELTSLSRIIDRNAVLKYLDRLGRL